LFEIFSQKDENEWIRMKRPRLLIGADNKAASEKK